MACGPGYPRCTEVATDPQHCGACDKACEQSYCDQGRCAAVEVVANDLYAYKITAYDQASLYLIGSGSSKETWRVLFDGGKTSSASHKRTFAPEASDGTHLYGCREGVPAPKDAPPGEHHGTCELVRSTIARGRIVRLATVERVLSGSFATDGTTLYWAVLTKDATSDLAEVQAMPVEGGDIRTLASDDGLRAIASAGGNVYWASSGPRGKDAGGGVYRLGKDESQPRQLAAGPASAVAVSGDEVFFARSNRIIRIPAAGGDEFLVVKDQLDGKRMSSSFRGIAVTDKDVYFATTGKDVNFATVRRIARPPRL